MYCFSLSRYYEYKVTLENVNTKEEVTVVKPEDKTPEKDHIEQWIVETTETMTNQTNTHVQSPIAHRKTTETVTSTEIENQKSETVKIPNGNVTTGLGQENQQTSDAIPLIIGGTEHENRAKEQMIDTWVASTVTTTELPKVPNGRHEETNITTETTEEWYDTEQDADTTKTKETQNTSKDDPWRTEEWTEVTKTQFTKEITTEAPQVPTPVQETTTVTETITQVENIPPERTTTDQEMEESKVQYEKEVIQSTAQVIKQTPMIQGATQVDGALEQLKSHGWTEETIQYETLIEPQEHPPQEEWKTDEWTEEHKIQYENEDFQDAPQAPTQDEQWKTEEWTEEQNIQYVNEISQDMPQEQPQEQWKTDEWTEEHKIQYQNEVSQNIPQEEQWKTEEWTEEHKIQYEREVLQDAPRYQAEPQEEQWRTDEWTEERKIEYEREVFHDAPPAQAQQNQEEQWRTDEWTEERKVEYEKELFHDAPQAQQEPQEWHTDEWTEERKIEYEKEVFQDASETQPVNNQQEEEWRTEEWIEERNIQTQQVKEIAAPKYETSRKGSIQAAMIKEVQPLSCQSDSGMQVVRRLSEVKHVTQFIKAEASSLDQQDGLTREQQFLATEVKADPRTEAVETVETKTELEDVEAMEEEREWTVTSGVMETVLTDQITRALGEEVRHFVIQGVVDPQTGNDISVQEAHRRKIIIDEEGIYYNNLTGIKIPIQEAMNKGLIKVAYQTVKKAKEEVSAIGMVTIKYSVDPMINKVIDEATGEEMTCQEAQIRGILDQKCEIYTMQKTRERFSIDQAIENGWVLITPGEYNVQTYAVTAIMDQRAKRKIPFAEAVEKDLFDRKTGHYINNVTGERVYVADAISRGYLQAKLVENNQTLDVDAENKMIVDRMENMRSTVLEKLGDLTDSLEQLH